MQLKKKTHICIKRHSQDYLLFAVIYKVFFSFMIWSDSSSDSVCFCFCFWFFHSHCRGWVVDQNDTTATHWHPGKHDKNILLFRVWCNFFFSSFLFLTRLLLSSHFNRERHKLTVFSLSNDKIGPIINGLWWIWQNQMENSRRRNNSNNVVLTFFLYFRERDDNYNF